MKPLITTSILFFALCSAMAQNGHSLTVIVKNFDSDQGKVKVGLYESASTYMKKTYRAVQAVVDNKDQVILVFEDVPNGSYAFSIYHDANENDQLDTNFIGIPTEDYAFSNNADGRFGPPEYELCVFEITGEDLTQTIELN
jgi:uncharacterized protein (DUF2141 family)